MNKILTILMVTVMIAATAAIALAIDTSEGYIDGTMGPNVTRTVGTPESIIATGGNITATNFTIEQQTDNWAGFFGNISQFPVLEGGLNNFYTWTGGISYTSGFVIFCNQSNIDWTNLANATAAERTAEDTALGIAGEPDSVTNTFTLSNTAELNINDNVFPAGGTLSVNTTGGTPWETVMIAETTSSLILYTAVINPSNTNYAGATADYQAMVPTSGAGSRTYYVYIGLA